MPKVIKSKDGMYASDQLGGIDYEWTEFLELATQFVDALTDINVLVGPRTLEGISEAYIVEVKTIREVKRESGKVIVKEEIEEINYKTKKG
jgi:hypothetical protein